MGSGSDSGVSLISKNLLLFMASTEILFTCHLEWMLASMNIGGKHAYFPITSFTYRKKGKVKLQSESGLTL
jgi:hypothetical protein